MRLRHSVATTLWVWLDLAALRNLFGRLVRASETPNVARAVQFVLDRIPLAWLGVRRPIDLNVASSDPVGAETQTYLWGLPGSTRTIRTDVDLPTCTNIVDVVVHGASGSITRGRDAIVPGLSLVEHPYAALRSDPTGRFQVAGRIIGAPQGEPILRLDEAAFAVSRFPGTWYHFVLETLGSLVTLDRLGILGARPVLLPEHALRSPSMLSAIRALAPDVEVVAVPSTRAVAVGRLSVPVPPSPYLVSLARLGRGWNGRPVPGYNLDTIERLRAVLRVLASSVPGPTATTRRHFIQRDHSLPDPRHLVDDQTRAAIDGLGGSMVDPGSLTFMAQLTCFANAEVLFGPSGSAWVNMLACTPGTRAIIVIGREHASWTIWSPLAELCEVKLTLIEADWEVRGGRRYLRADETQFRAAMKIVGE